MIILAYFSVMKNQQLAERNDEAYSNSYSSSNSSSSSSNSSNELKQFARIVFNIANTLDNNAKLTLTPPDGVRFNYNGSDGGTVENYYGNISGKYTFTYSAITGVLGEVKESNRKTYKGSFPIDGKNSYYDIDIYDFGFSVDIIVSGLH